MMNKKLPLFMVLLVLSVWAKAQQKVIPLYDGPAPGSESWTWSEQENSDNMYHAHTIYNISKPTITVYTPDSAINTGTAVIICPGGGFHSLSIMQEGYAVAKWFQKRGVTAFLLKYRLMHIKGDDPYKQEIADRTSADANKERAIIVPMAIADGRQAIAYVRAHAAEYGISPSRIGIIGFSAGGTIAASTAYNYTPANRPDFVAPIYAYFPPEMQSGVPADAPPIFIAAASDDQGGLETHSSALYDTWIASKHSAELHMYSKGGHGFGMNTQNLPSDTWSDRFWDWLNIQGFLPPNDAEIAAKKKAEDWANFQKYIETRIHTDWAYVNCYTDRNTRALAKPASTRRVVFMGNSITQNWWDMDSTFFVQNGYLGRGIGGQTSPQMLVRFREDVINLKPRAVVIEAGTNDIAQNTGYIALEDTYYNIISMAELAKANGIIPIIGSILPAVDFSWHRGLEPAEKIIKVNNMLKAYAAKHHLIYIDYWAALVNDKNGFKPELTLDGLVHPNMAGYKIMEPLAKKAIDQVLKK
jgi:acetyl esterase/lipase/lysophospholipase L1-like esterase